MNAWNAARGVRPRLLLGLTLGIVATLAPADSTHAACTYQELVSGVSVQTTLGPDDMRFNQAAPYWSVVAVRPEWGSDWDLPVYAATAAEPACVTNLLQTSAYAGSAVDFVLGDFNHTAAGMYHPAPYRYSGFGTARVEWDNGYDLLAVDGATVARDMEAGDVVEVLRKATLLE